MNWINWWHKVQRGEAVMPLAAASVAVEPVAQASADEAMAQTVAWLDAAAGEALMHVAWAHAVRALRQALAARLMQDGRTSLDASLALQGLQQGDLVFTLSYLRDLAIEPGMTTAESVTLLREQAAISPLPDAMKLLREVVQRQPDELLNWHLLGDVARAAGDFDVAEEAYRECLQRRQNAVVSDEDEVRDSSLLLESVGDMRQARGALPSALESYQQAVAVVERLLRTAPSNVEWQHDLSVLQEKIGDMNQTQGNLPAALQAYRLDMAVAEQLSLQVRDNLQWQRDWAVSSEKMGEIQQAQGDIGGALQSYQRSLEILEHLVAQSPEQTQWLRDLSVIYDRIGAIQNNQGSLASAQAAYQKSLAIRENLVAQSPENLAWQRELSVCYDELGTIQQAQGDMPLALESFYKSLLIAEQLIQRSPDCLEWQHDLLISYEKIGNVQQGKGQFEAALKLYQKALRIAERLVQAQPANVAWQRDMSVLFEKLGGVQCSLQDWAAARQAYQHSFSLIEQLVRLDLSNVLWRTHLAVTYWKLAQVCQGASVQQYLQSGLMILETLAQEGRLSALQQPWLATFREALLTRRDGTSPHFPVRQWRAAISSVPTLLRTRRVGVKPRIGQQRCYK